MRLFRKKETYNEQLLREAREGGAVSKESKRVAEPTAAQKEALEEVDDPSSDAAQSQMLEGGFWRRFLYSLVNTREWGSPYSPGLRDAIREDDEDG